jgi:hypothetical protein
VVFRKTDTATKTLVAAPPVCEAFFFLVVFVSFLRLWLVLPPVLNP